MTLVRRIVLVLCLALVAACQGPAGPGQDPAPDEPAAVPDGDAAGAPEAPGDFADGGAGAVEPPDAEPDAGAPQAPEPDDLGPLGAMCRQYLRAPGVVVEIDWQRGAEPTAAARQHLVAILRQATKADVTLAGGSEIPGEAEVSSPDSLRALAAAHRDSFSTRDRAALYVLSVRGRFQEESALGVAYRASEFAIFPDLIGGLSALLGGRTAIERAVLVHEAGHLLCLVNIGYTSAFDREDPEHPKHSSDRASAMHWAIETSAVAQLFSGPPPDSFTAQDLADLEGLRTGRY